MVMFIYLLSAIVAMSFLLLKDYGKMNGAICGLDLGAMPLSRLAVLCSLPASVSHSISIIVELKFQHFRKTIKVNRECEKCESQ